MPAPFHFHILFVEGGLPTPRVDAGSLANLELIALIQSQGHRVSYLYTGHHPWGSPQALMDLGCAIIDGVGLTRAQQESLLRAHAPNATILSRPGPALQWIDALTALAIPSVYFGHDLHQVRLEREYALHLGESSAVKLLQACLVHKAIERHLWVRADVVVYPTQWECDYVIAQCGRSHAISMPIYDVEVMAQSQPQIATVANQLQAPFAPYPLLFVGGSHHAPNVDGLMWFVREVAPLLSLPIELQVVGQWDGQAQEQLQCVAHTALCEGSRLTWCGGVSEEALRRLYVMSALVIAPLRYGAGLKRKVVEALMFERPLLTTPIGLEGIALEPSQLAQVSSPIDPVPFAKALETHLRLPPAVQRDHSRALARQIASQFSRERRLERLAQIFAML